MMRSSARIGEVQTLPPIETYIDRPWIRELDHIRVKVIWNTVDDARKSAPRTVIRIPKFLIKFVNSALVNEQEREVDVIKMKKLRYLLQLDNPEFDLKHHDNP